MLFRSVHLQWPLMCRTGPSVTPDQEQFHRLNQALQRGDFLVSVQTKPASTLLCSVMLIIFLCCKICHRQRPEYVWRACRQDGNRSSFHPGAQRPILQSATVPAAETQPPVETTARFPNPSPTFPLKPDSTGSSSALRGL